LSTVLMAPVALQPHIITLTVTEHLQQVRYALGWPW